MKQNGLFVAIGVILVAAVAAFAYMSMTGVDDEDATNTDDQHLNGEETEPFAGITHVDMKQFYEDSEHVLVGELMMPTPCDLLEYSVEVRESMPEQVHITFDVINTAEVCAQVMTAQRFMVQFQASKEAVISAELMDYQLEVNLLEPEPGETPEDFELFIKG